MLDMQKRTLIESVRKADYTTEYSVVKTIRRMILLGHRGRLTACVIVEVKSIYIIVLRMNIYWCIWACVFVFVLRGWGAVEETVPHSARTSTLYNFRCLKPWISLWNFSKTCRWIWLWHYTTHSGNVTSILPRHESWTGTTLHVCLLWRGTNSHSSEETQGKTLSATYYSALKWIVQIGCDRKDRRPYSECISQATRVSHLYITPMLLPRRIYCVKWWQKIKINELDYQCVSLLSKNLYRTTWLEPSVPGKAADKRPIHQGIVTAAWKGARTDNAGIQYRPGMQNECIAHHFVCLFRRLIELNF